jgi:chemotaxis protein CheX
LRPNNVAGASESFFSDPGEYMVLTVSASNAHSSQLTAEYVNPLIVATRNVFELMLDCVPNRTGLRLRSADDPRHEVSAVIGVTGRAVGTIVLSLSQRAACEALKRMIGTETSQITGEVCDAVGELMNMIAGNAKGQLAKYELSVSLPNVISGGNHRIHFPSNVRPMVIAFESEIGPLTIEVGFTGV